MNMSHDQTTLNSIKRLATKECANFSGGYCLPEDHPCHMVNRAYEALCDGVVDCDYFLFAVLPLRPDLNIFVWLETFGEEGQAGVRWEKCIRCHSCLPSKYDFNPYWVTPLCVGMMITYRWA